jgi:hypothetical protein
MTRKPDIHFHIEELILDGFPSGDRHRISAAMQGELARLFAERQTPAGLTNDRVITRLDAGSFQTNAASRPEATGSQVANAVFRGLSQ